MWKTNSETYHFYFFVGKFPKLFNFSDSKKKSYLVKLNILKENAIFGLQKILLDNFPRDFHISCAIGNGSCIEKVKIGHWAKFRVKTEQMFSADFISGSRDFTQHLSSGMLILSYLYPRSLAWFDIVKASFSNKLRMG